MKRLLTTIAISATCFFGLRADEPIQIGSRLELFADGFLVHSMTGASLELHRPVPREVAIVHDTPWEGNISYYHTVFQDGDLYRMYYRGQHYDEPNNRYGSESVCYAESRDGIHWTKPELGLVEHDGSRKNNIIWKGKGSHNFAPFKDSNPACPPEARYKALAGGPLFAFRSRDGIRWEKIRDEPVITKGAFDSQNLGFWDSTRNRYVEFHRGFRDGLRDIMTSTSEDFIHWSEPEWLIHSGAPREHLYTNQIQPYPRAPHLFVGFPKRFVPTRRGIDHRIPGVSDACFMISRDGRTFHRRGEAFIRPGLQSIRWGNRNNMIACGIVETEADTPGMPRELSFYSIEGYYQGTDCRMRRYTLRPDGFVSVSAPRTGGEIITRPVRFSGSTLELNYSTSAAGSVLVELQDEDGKVVPGFGLGDCEEIYGDHIQRTVSWKPGKDLGALSDQPVRLRFRLVDADLFSFRFR